jgi:hypothetical protein
MVNEYRRENGRRDGTNTIHERKEKESEILIPASSLKLFLM